MAWTDPKTWVTQTVLTASDLNTEVRDNLNALKTPPKAQYEADEVSDHTRTGAGFADVDATNFKHTIITTGGDVMVGFAGTVRSDTISAEVYFDVTVDGTPHAGDDGILVVSQPAAGTALNGSFVIIITGLSAASHEFRLTWKTNGGIVTMFAGAGSPGFDVHPQFWVREI